MRWHIWNHKLSSRPRRSPVTQQLFNRFQFKRLYHNVIRSLFTHSEQFASSAVIFPTLREGSTLNLRRGRGVLSGLVTSRHGVPSMFGRDEEEVCITTTNYGQGRCRSCAARSVNLNLKIVMKKLIKIIKKTKTKTWTSRWVKSNYPGWIFILF